MWLIMVDTLAITLPIAFTLALLTFAIPFTLCAEVVAEHCPKDKILFGCELVQRTGDDEPDGFQTLSPSEIHIQILLSCWL